MALNYSDVSAGDTILAAHPNALADDIIQHNHDGTDTEGILTPIQMIITPGSAVVGLTITQAHDAKGLSIDSESTSNWAQDINCKFGISITQDISNGRALEIERSINEAGILSLVRLAEGNAAGTQPVLEIFNAGSGYGIDMSSFAVNKPLLGVPVDTTAEGTYYGRMAVYVTGVGVKYVSLYNA